MSYPLGGVQVGDGDVDLPEVVVVGDGCAGREAALGEVAVPLGDGGVWFVGEVEAAYQFAALPAPVGRLGAACEHVGAVGGVADPFAGDGDGIDVKRHVLGDAGVLELGDELCDAPVVAAGQQLDGLVVIEGLDRAIEPDRDVLGIHDPGEPVGHL